MVVLNEVIKTLLYILIIFVLTYLYTINWFVQKSIYADAAFNQLGKGINCFAENINLLQYNLSCLNHEDSKT